MSGTIGRRPNKRHKLQFTLMRLFLLVIVLSVLFAIYMGHIRKRREAVEAITALGGQVVFDYESDKLGGMKRAHRPQYDHWLPEDFDAAAHDVVSVSFVNASQDVNDAALSYLPSISEVKCLVLMRALKFSRLSCGVTDTGVQKLEALKRLEILQIGGAPITNDAINSISKLKRLRILWLEDTAISDVGLVGLEKLRNLSELNLTKTNVTARGVAKLQQRMPACTIYWDGQ